jgi:hypothetical protein
MSRPTKQELEGELEEMRAKLEEAHSLLGDALGYEPDEDEEDEEEVEGEDDEQE